MFEAHASFSYPAGHFGVSLQLDVILANRSGGSLPLVGYGVANDCYKRGLEVKADVFEDLKSVRCLLKSLFRYTTGLENLWSMCGRAAQCVSSRLEICVVSSGFLLKAGGIGSAETFGGLK